MRPEVRAANQPEHEQFVAPASRRAVNRKIEALELERRVESEHPRKSGCELGDHGFVQILISDTGAGMSPNEVDIAMRPFGQVDSGFNKRHDGSGLGLPISYALAKLHGGNLIIDSEKGRGTRVYILLPAYSPNANAPRAGAARH